MSFYRRSIRTGHENLKELDARVKGIGTGLASVGLYSEQGKRFDFSFNVGLYIAEIFNSDCPL